MAKQRLVNTKFWDDTYIIELDSLEKLLYLYLLTNSLTNLSGIYELNVRRIAFDTGIDKDMVLKIFGRFEKAEKIYYYEGWIFIKNFIKNQNNSPSIDKGIERERQNIPFLIREHFEAKQSQDGHPPYTPHTPPIPSGTPNLTKPNLTKPNLRGTELIATKVATLENIIKENFSLEFITNIYNKYGMNKNDFKEECEEFLLYRKEKSINGKKERWEKEKTFDPKLRFRTWIKRSKKWSNRVLVNSEDEERKKKLAELEERKKNLFNNI